tara:strand:- start:12497 stop:13375 length:879 start_codon:yes stop_codon:yes gene_type:complete
MGITNKILRFLKQPYPFYFRGKDLAIIAIIVFLMSLIFNYFFRPFDVYTPEHRLDYFWISFIHSMTPLLVFLLWLPILYLAPRIDEGWNIGREILFIVIFLLLVGLGQFLFRDVIYDNPNNWSWRYLFEEIGNTIMVGILFIFILVPLNYNRLNRQNIRNAGHVSPYKSHTTAFDHPSELFIRTNVKNDDFQLPIASFLYAKAERNYAEIYLKADSGISKLLKRISISDLQSQLAIFPQIAKTHRSYLVNLQEVDSVSGNAQGYKLVLKDHSGVVPVSRNMIAQFESKMSSL